MKKHISPPAALWLLGALLLSASAVMEMRGRGAGPGLREGGSGPGEQIRVDVNRAGLDELKALPGLGEELARRVLERRKETGGFRRIEDLAAVKGIGKATVEGLADYATCSPAGEDFPGEAGEEPWTVPEKAGGSGGDVSASAE